MKTVSAFGLLFAIALALSGCSGGSSSSTSTTVAPIEPTEVTPHTVVFLGDSVTAGFGYCGTEGGANSGNISCSPNQSFSNNWILGTNSLKACQPAKAPAPLNDRCSNNNDKGAPWNAQPWKAGSGAPSVAYSYQLAKMQNPQGAASIVNWAMTGSTPAQWDPVTGGVFGTRLARIHNATVVFTLGANPLLSDYLKITGFGVYSIANGVCANTAVLNGKAASLDDSSNGILNCLNTQWNAIQQSEHLTNIYATLLGNHNQVLVLGYPQGCPWSFGNWQSTANPLGPSYGKACSSQSLPSVANPSQQITQFDQAVTVGTAINNRLNQLVASAQTQADQSWFPQQHLGRNIQFVLPDQTSFMAHQAWNARSWFFKNDTWVHPNALGQHALAISVSTAMCQDFHHWCGAAMTW